MSALQYSGGGGYAPYSGGYEPYWSPVPNQPAWMEQQALARRAYDQAKARLESQRSSIANAAGYIVNKNTGKLSINSKNEVGGLQMMLRGQAQEDTGMRNAFVNRGIQGSGLQGQAGGQLHVQHGAESAQFANSLQGQLGSIQGQIQDAGNQWASAQWQAQRDQAMNAIANNQFNAPILPPEQPQQQPSFNTQVNQPAGGGNINMLNNPQFMEFLKGLFQSGGHSFIGNGVNLLK